MTSEERGRGRRLLRAPLLHFLLLGALLFTGASLSERVGSTEIVEVPQTRIQEAVAAHRDRFGRAPDAAEREALEQRVIAEAIWLADARRRALHRLDPVVRQRLVLNMRFLEDAAAESSMPRSPTMAAPSDAPPSDAELLERAYALGLDRTDPVVRRRLIDRAQAIVRARVRARPIDEEILAAHHRRHPERWRRPPRLDLTHVYLSRDEHGPRLANAAEALLERLRREALPPERAVLLGDPFLAGHRLRAATPTRIASRLGPEFEAALREAPTGRWIGPVESAFGLHAVWIHAREPAATPPFEAVRDEVREDWIEERTRRALREHVERRRAEVTLRFVDSAA